MWLASKKEEKLLKQITHSFINILCFRIIIFFPKLDFHYVVASHFIIPIQTVPIQIYTDSLGSEKISQQTVPF